MEPHYILIVIMLGHSSAGGSGSVAMQEFSSRDSCERAGVEFQILSCSCKPTDEYFTRLTKDADKFKCVPKTAE